jgi:site-specific recombinase XerD
MIEYYMMSPNTLERYTELFQRIIKNSKTSFHGIQLECITKLVFFGGVQRKQIRKLKVHDVFDGNGRPLDKIKNSKKEIILNDEMKRALEDYFKELKSRRSSKAKRKSFLFPNYSYDGKLRRHWKKFGTSYSQIKRDGELYEKEEEQRRYEERAPESQDFDPENFEGDYITDIDYDR